MKITLIIVYIILLLLAYIAIHKRLTFLTNRHIWLTWCNFLKERKHKIFFLIWFFLFILGSLTISLILILL